jgi:hypothetical protein
VKLRIHDINHYGQSFDIDWPGEWPLPRRAETIVLPEGDFIVRDVFYFRDRAEPLIVLEVTDMPGGGLGSTIRTHYSHLFPEDKA